MTAQVDKTDEMTFDQIKSYVDLAKKNNISNDVIYDTVRQQPIVQKYQTLATANGVNDKDQRRFIGKELDLDVRKKPNLLQSALETLAGPIPEIGRQLGIKSLEELKAAPGGFVSGLVSAPRTLIDLPTSVSQASTQFHRPEIEQPESVTGTRLGQFRPEQAYVPPGVEEGQISPYAEVPETGDIGPLLRAILPSGEQAMENLVAETSMPETTAGEAALRASQFAGGGAIGGPVGTAIGTGIGLLDYVLEKNKYSPEARLAIESLVGLVQSPYGKGPKPARPPGTPPSPPSRFGEFIQNTVKPELYKDWTKSMLRKAKSDSINGVSDLSAKILLRDPENINFQTIQDLKSLGFDLADVPIQAYTKGGMPNWLEGAQENALWGGKRYNKLMNEFTEGMTKRADSILDSIPIEEINEAVTQESLGSPKFENYVKKTLDQLAPNLNIDRKTLGKLGTDAIEQFDVSLKNQADALYGASKFTDVDFIAPGSNAYKNLRRSIQQVKENISGEGFIGADREGALRVINDLKKLFEAKKKTGKEILGPDGEPIIERGIKYNDLRKNLQALNNNLSYDEPGIINLLEPVSKSIRDIFASEAPNNPKVQSFVNANEVFANRAQMLKNPKIRKFYNMDDEQFYNAMKKPSNLEAFKNFAEKTNLQAPYDMLRGGLIAKELGPAFEAQTPGEMATKLTDGLIERIRDIQQFYPEYPDLANGLKTAKENARQFNTPEEVQRGQIRQEAMDYQINGEVPSKILATMDSPKGINLVKSTLSKTKQGQSIYNSMARKKLEQVFYGKTRKTEISIKDLAEVFKDKESDAIVKTLMSDKNYNELQTLSRVAESLEQGKKVSPIMKKQFEKMILTAGGFASYMSGGVLGGAGTIGVSALARAALSKNFRKSISQRSEGIYQPTQQTQP